MLVSDVLKGLAIQAKCRLDINEYDSEGRPILRFIAFGQTDGVFPDLEPLSDSKEGTFISDKDGVRITRRGFSGSVLAPANSRSPVEIEVPFAPYAIAYESAPSFDAQRCMPNASLEFKEQWKCGHRGAFDEDYAAGEEVYPLNPDGWVVGGHLFRYDTTTSIKNFPYKHGQDKNAVVFGFDNDTETVYHAGGWAGYYPVHAIYDVDRGDLTDEQIKDRQKNYLISYALTFGRYIRGERRRLSRQFKGCVAPLWSDIATGMTYEFTPNDTAVTYIAVEISRDIFSDIITVEFEEESPTTLPMSYKIEGDQKGSGSIGGVGTSGDIGGTPPATNGVTRNIKFYTAGVVSKELEMYVQEFYDAENERTVVISGVPYPYDEVAPDDYGDNSQYFFHYNGAEIGNVEIVGVSAEGVPDYWASAISQFKHGTNNTDITYSLNNKIWSEDRGGFLIQRPLEKANIKRRIYVAGRFECDRTAGVFTNLTWHSLVTALYPLSNDDCKSATDFGNLAASAALPTLVGNGNSVDIIWATHYKPVTIMAQAWGHNIVVNAWDWQIGANPVSNQTCASNPASNVNSVNINLWLNDFAAGAGARHILEAGALDLDGQAGLDVFIWDFWGTLEIKGENAVTI
jgi:hypothetical protein